MSQITFRVDYPQSFRRGVDCPQPPTVTLDVDPAKLSQGDRDTIAERLSDKGVVLHKTETGHRREEPIVAAAPTVDALLSAIRASDEAIRTYDERRKGEVQAHEAESLEHDRQQMAQPKESLLSTHVTIDSLGNVVERSTWCAGNESWRQTYYPDVVAVTEATYLRRWATLYVLDKTDEGRALQASLASQTEAAKRAAIEAAGQKLHSTLVDMRVWIEAHGSARLKKLAAAGIAHRQTYLRERSKHEQGEFEAALASDRPGWYETTDDEVSYDVADVSLRTLALLDAARQIDPAAKLAKRKSDGKYVAVVVFRGRLIAWPKD